MQRDVVAETNPICLRLKNLDNTKTIILLNLEKEVSESLKYIDKVLGSSNTNRA